MPERTREGIALDQAGKDIELARLKLQAAVGRIAPPDSLVSELHEIPFVEGESVIDTITGETVTVLGSGVRNVEAD